MAERGLLGRFLDGGHDDPESEASAAGADPFATAVAADAARFDPQLSRKAGAYLDRQSRLVEIQTEHLHEQREVQISHLKIRRFTDQLKAATQVFFILIATVIGLGLAVMLHDAFTSRSVVVDAFKAPSALASRGLTGDVVASGVLDTLQKLQAATRSVDKGLHTTSAWASDIKVDVPETGVSLGEIDRLLHARFGHDLHIDGDLVQTETGGLALTVRGDDIPAKTFTGAPGALDTLTSQAAEYVYGRSQPFQYATYLIDVSRYADALAYLPGAYARTVNDADRAKLANVWGNTYATLNQPAASADKYRLAMSLAPNNWTSWVNLVGELEFTEGEEAAWRESRIILRAAERASKKDRPELRLLINPAQITWDLPLMLRASLADAARNGGAGSTADIEGPGMADTHAQMHDPAGAARAMAGSDPDDATAKAEALLLQAYGALDRGDASAAVPPMEAFFKAWRADTNLQNLLVDNVCFLGLSYGLSGRLSDAEAAFVQAGRWSRCYAFHGDVLAHAGDLAGAQRVWAEGLRIAPDLPMVYLHRGVSELNRGDLAAAQADLATAHAKAPHFADPLKAWGDLLARQGRWKAALARYDEALNYAPAWAALRQARDAAARKV